MKQLRKTLSVANGTTSRPRSAPRRRTRSAAVLETGECGNALPIAPTTVPHIFSRKNERMQFSVRLVRKHRISVFVEAPREAKVVALNVPKKKVKGTVRITLVARTVARRRRDARHRHCEIVASVKARLTLRSAAMADVQEQLQEIGAQLDWVRDYL